MVDQYNLFWTPLSASQRAAEPTPKAMPSSFATEQDSLLGAFRALDQHFAVHRIDCPNGSTITADEIIALYRACRN